MPNTDLVQSIRRYVEPIVFNAYDNTNTTSAFPRLAMEIDNTVLQEDPVDLEFWGAWFQLREWVDEKSTQEVFKGTFSIPIKSYEVTAKANAKKLRRPNTLAKLDGQAAEMAKAFVRDKVGILMDVILDNPLAYDGQNLLDSDHTHPDGQTYDNIINGGTGELASFTAPAAPTVDECKALLHACMRRLVTNRAVLSRLLDAAELTENIVVITHNPAYWTQFNKLRTMMTIDQNSNEFYQNFTLFHDPSSAGSSNYVEVIYSAPGGPRPILFVVDEEPAEVKIDDSKLFQTGEIAYGLEGYYGAKPGWPQSIVQARPA